MERYFNFYSTTVAIGGYTAGSGVLNVASTTGISLNAGDTCRLLVYNVISGVITPVVLLVATVVNSGTQFAVTAEGTDANALAGASVINVLSAGGMNQIRQDISGIGTYANLPSTTNQKEGAQYSCTDSPYKFIFDGTLWQPFWSDGYNVTQPVPANFAWQSQGSATITTTYGTLRLFRATEVAFNIHAYVTPVPGSTPYHVILGYQATGNSIGTNIGGGLCISDGTKYEICYFPFSTGGGNSNELVIFYAANNTTNSATVLNSQPGFLPYCYPPNTYVRFGDDGTTNKTVDIGSTPNGPWVNVFSQGRTTDLTASQVGIFVNGGTTFVELFHYSTTS